MEVWPLFELNEILLTGKDARRKVLSLPLAGESTRDEVLLFVIKKSLQKLLVAFHWIDAFLF
jgi:hypothetical protein